VVVLAKSKVVVKSKVVGVHAGQVGQLFDVVTVAMLGVQWVELMMVEVTGVQEGVVELDFVEEVVEDVVDEEVVEDVEVVEEVVEDVVLEDVV
jgi:hypothetical protein